MGRARIKTSSKRIFEFFERDHAETAGKIDQLEKVLLRLHYEGKTSLGKNLKDTGELLQFFEREIREHMSVEEKTLFPFLKRHIPRLEPLISLLSSEHEDYRRNLGPFKSLVTRLRQTKAPFQRSEVVQEIRGKGTYLIALLKAHLKEETEILYRVADQELRWDEKIKLISKPRKK